MPWTLKTHSGNCRALFDLIRKDYRDNGRKSEASLIQTLKHLEPFFSDRSATRVSTNQVETYKDERRKEGAAPATINLELACLKRCFNLAIHKELLTHKPHFKMYHLNNARRGFFEPREYIAMRDALSDNFKNILRFGYISGWRKSEILGLRWDQNFDGKAVRIYDSKSGEGRSLPLEGKVAEIVQQQLDRRVNGCELIFHNDGVAWNRNTFYARWYAACKVTGVKKRFHDLRRMPVSCSYLPGKQLSQLM